MGPGLGFESSPSAACVAVLFVPAFVVLPFFFFPSADGGAGALSSLTVGVADGKGVPLESDDLSTASLSG